MGVSAQMPIGVNFIPRVGIGPEFYLVANPGFWGSLQLKFPEKK